MIDWQVVYQDMLPKIYTFFCYRVGNHLLAEDLTSQTFEKAWKGRNHYRKDIGAISNWLFGIARNVAADHFRKQQGEAQLDELGDLPADYSLEEIVQQHSEFYQLSLLLTQLSVREQELVSLKYGAGLTNRAIAEITKLSASNVGIILHRVVKKLRTQWEKNHE